MSDGQLVAIDRPAMSAGELVFSPDHQIIALAEEDHSIRIIDFKSGATTGFLRGHTSKVSAVAISHDGKRLASGGWMDGTVRIWDIDAHRQLSQANVSRCSDLVFSPDGRTLVTGHADQRAAGLIVWNLTRDALLNRPKFIELRAGSNQAQPIHHLRYSPDGHWVAFGDDQVHVVDVSRGEVRIFKGDSNNRQTICSYLFFDDNDWLVSVYYKGDLTVWDVTTGTEVFHLSGAVPRVTSMARAPGAETVLTASEWNTVTVWDLKARSVARKSLRPKLPEGLNHLKKLILSDDGLALAVLADGQIYLCELKDLIPD